MPSNSKSPAIRLLFGVSAIKAEIDKFSDKPVPINWVYEAIKSGLLDPAVKKTGHRSICGEANALHLRLRQIFSS